MNLPRILMPPFLRTTDSVSKIMADVLFALLPVCFMAWVAFGMEPVLVILVACGSAVTTEFLFSRLYADKTDGVADGSSLVTGTLLACTLAPFTPLYVVAFGGAMAVLFGKLLTGGLGRNRFNPALVGREFMTVFFPAIMTSGTIWYNIDAVNVARLDWLPDSFMDSLLFRGSGAIGEYSVVLLISGGLYLLLRNRISWHIPVALTVSFTVLFTVLFFLLPEGDYRFSLGGVLLGAIYMATDMPTSSSTSVGRLYYGAMIGAVAVTCIAFGVKNEYMSYSILLLNAFIVPIDWVFRPRVWAGKKRLAARIGEGAGLTVAILGTTGIVIWLHDQEWIMYAVFLYIAWSIGGFFLRQRKPDVLTD